MSGVGTRIRKAREALGMTQQHLAQAVGVSQQAIVELESGRTRKTRHSARFAHALGQDALWLETGEGRMRSAGQADGASPAGSGMMPGLDRFVRLPVFDMRPGTGAVSLMGAAAANAGATMFREDWLAALTPSAHRHLLMVIVRGDAMDPSLRGGDQVLVDMARTDPRDEGLYLLALDSTLMIRRVAVHPLTRLVSIIPDNPRYRAFHDLDAGSLAVTGRVVWTGCAVG